MKNDSFSVINVMLAFVACMATTAILTGLLVMLLWNWLMPAIFGLNEINYIQGWGLAFMTSILFKSDK